MLRDSSRLRICFFAHSSNLFGAERTLLELVAQLVEDHSVDCLVVLPGDGPSRECLERAGAIVLQSDYGWWCQPYSISSSEANQRLTLDLQRVLETTVGDVASFAPDVICTNTMVIPFGAVTAASLAKPHIWNVREWGPSDGLHFLFSFDDVLRFIDEMSDLVFCPGESVLEALVPNLTRDRHEILRPAIDCNLRPLSVEIPVLPFQLDGLRLAEFAALIPAKGQKTAIRAMSELQRRGQAVELLIAGDGEFEYEWHLRGMVDRLGLGSRVHFLGFLEWVAPVMNAVDAVVVSAPIHGFGRTAVEAMSLGKPIIYPMGTGFDDYMTDGLTGLGYAAGDSVSLANRISWLIREPAAARRIGRNGQDYVRRTLTRDNFSGLFYRRAVALRDSPIRDRRAAVEKLLQQAALGSVPFDENGGG